MMISVFLNWFIWLELILKYDCSGFFICIFLGMYINELFDYIVVFSVVYLLFLLFIIVLKYFLINLGYFLIVVFVFI